ncbi:hypothetical protein JCM10207_006778 [Rhodosporidiobolus poonsookiae]
MSPFVYLVTGASRGLGFAYSKAVLAQSPDNRIIATARTPETAKQLQQLAEENPGRVEIVKLDTSDKVSVQEFAAALETNPLAKDGIDCLVNNAGICLDNSFQYNIFTAPDDELPTTLQTNLYGVIWVTKAVLPFLHKGRGKRIVNVSSVSGSIATMGPMRIVPMYGISKAALNMATAKMASTLASDGFTVVAFHPGWVKTEINSDGKGDITVDEAVDAALKNLFPRLTAENNGKFLWYDGSVHPW